MREKSKRMLAAIGAFWLLAAPAAAQEISYPTLVAPVLSGSSTVLGETLAYPTGPAKVTAVIVTVPPGGETGWHVHPVPLFGYILEGVLTVDYGPGGTRTYRTGEGLLEAMAASHNGMNLGAVPVRILAVYMGAEGLANAAATDAPHVSAPSPLVGEGWGGGPKTDAEGGSDPTPSPSPQGGRGTSP